MVLETVRTMCLANGESEKSLHKQGCGTTARNGTSGRHENLVSNGNGASPSYNGLSGEDDNLRRSKRDADGDLDMDMLGDGVVSKKAKQRELTFQDMYNSQDLFDDDEEDDSDWEPVQKHVELVKWFCTNCTMVNLGDYDHCDICGEHKESGIMRHGFFASPLLQDAGLTEHDSEVEGRCKDMSIQHSASDSTTAIGFDERMLLHSEVRDH